MEYMEIPTIPKLDNVFASRGSPATMKDTAPRSRENNGYGLLPGLPFHSAMMRPPATLPPKTSSAALPPLPGRRESCASPPGSIFKDCLDSLATGVSAALRPPVKEKPKRVRKSRAGTTPKKRGIADLVLDVNFDAAHQTPPVSPPKRRRPSAKSVGNTENAEKPPPRKRNRSKAKPKDEHASSSTNETSFSQSDLVSSKGILGVYGLETKTLDLTHYMKDISLESLLAGDFNMPPLPRKQGPPPSSMVENSFGLHVSSILQNLRRSSSIDQPRSVSLFSKPIESKPVKFPFDLESTPLDESEESLGSSMLDNKMKAPCYEAPAGFMQSSKTQDALSLFSLETTPVIPPADFWNTLQIHPNVSLNSLITQVSATSDSRFFPSETGSSCDKSSSLPPSIFSLGSTQVPQETACDRLASSKLNHWFRAEPPKLDFSDVVRVSASHGNKFPFKLDTENTPRPMVAEKHGPKEGLFDIDLNKQSPEAEAAESTVHSTSIFVSRMEVGNTSPVAVQARIDTDNTDDGSLSEHRGTDMDVSDPVKEAGATCHINSVIDNEVVDLVSNKGPSSQQDCETTERLSQQSSLVSVDQVKDASMNASTSLPTLLVVPDAPELQEMCSDVPYSPGMQATARLLCRMAISSSPFYVEKDEKDDQHAHAPVPCNDSAFEPPTKAVKVVSSVEKDGRSRKSPALHENRDKEYMHKVHAKDGKEKFSYGQMVSNSTLVADKTNGSEPWASTPPRHAPKNVASRVSGSQSSESDRSPCHGPREHSSNGNHGNTNKMQRDQQAGTGAVSRVSSSFNRKDSKANHTPVAKTTLLQTLPTIKSSSVSTQKKSSACEMKQSSTSHGEGFTKISRPRSNTSKNCLQAQRSTHGFSVQPRNFNGCAIKSPNSRHVLPYVGEVRHGLE